MVTTLLRALNTNKLDILVANMEMPPIDIDVMLYEAEEAGEVKIDRKKNTIEVIADKGFNYQNVALRGKVEQLIHFYDKQEANITKSRLEGVILDPARNFGYPLHDYYCTMYALEQDGEVKTYELSVPEIKNKRPYRNFKFYTYLDHQEFGARAVNNFIDQHTKK